MINAELNSKYNVCRKCFVSVDYFSFNIISRMAWKGSNSRTAL